jgi:hypothetical protein
VKCFTMFPMCLVCITAFIGVKTTGSGISCDIGLNITRLGHGIEDKVNI